MIGRRGDTALPLAGHVTTDQLMAAYWDVTLALLSGQASMSRRGAFAGPGKIIRRGFSRLEGKDSGAIAAPAAAKIEHWPPPPCWPLSLPNTIGSRNFEIGLPCRPLHVWVSSRLPVLPLLPRLSCRPVLGWGVSLFAEA